MREIKFFNETTSDDLAILYHLFVDNWSVWDPFLERQVITIAGPDGSKLFVCITDRERVRTIRVYELDDSK